MNFLTVLDDRALVKSMESVEIVYTSNDFSDFRDWIRLNLDGLTWQGRYTKEFEDFWEYFFVDDISITEMMQRFDYACAEIKLGPLGSWFNWLREKFLSYTYIYKNVSLYQLALLSNTPLPELASILRNFFLDIYPYLDDYFSSAFQVSNVASENLDLTFNKISKEMSLDNNFYGSREYEVMPSMEVTLFKEWKRFLKKMRKDFHSYSKKYKGGRPISNVKKPLALVREVTVLLVVGFLLIFIVRTFNRWYEDYLSQKIKIHEPQLLWPKKTLKFKENKAPADQKFKHNLKTISEIKVEEKDDIEFYEETEVLPNESDVMLTSWKSLPKDFDIADLEQSDYEEFKKGGYRDSRFGNRIVYRILMRAVSTLETSKKLNGILDKYNVTQADNVRPGTFVPGGVYYNLYVPQKLFKDFVMNVMKIDEAVVYESRTRRRNPVGKNKVFIWIKTY